MMMDDAQEEAASGNIGIFQETGRKGRQERLVESLEDVDARRAHRQGEESGPSERGEAEEDIAWYRRAVYALRDHDSNVFYIGRTDYPLERLGFHKRAFGRDITMELLQIDFSSESLEEAEARWIHQHLAGGGKLLNRRIPPIKKGKERDTVMIRGVSLSRWKTVRELTEKRGLKLKYAMDQMFDWWIKENGDKL